MDIWGKSFSLVQRPSGGSVLGLFRNSEEVSMTEVEQARRKELGDGINKVAKSYHVGFWWPCKELFILS